MPIIDIQSLLFEQPESGSSTPGSSFTIIKTTRIYKFKTIYQKEIISAIEGEDQGIEESDGFLIDWDIEAGIGYSTLTCLFSTALADGSLPSIHKITNQPFNSMTQTPDNIPLEQLVNFKTNWIYDLAAANGVTAEFPGWATATTTTMSAADAEKYYWVKDSSQVKAGWYIQKGKTKKGATEKQSSNAIIQEDVWTETTENAIEFMNEETQRKNPYRTFGIEGQWLALPSVMVPDGDLWKISTTHINATTWDEDIYGTL